MCTAGPWAAPDPGVDPKQQETLPARAGPEQSWGAGVPSLPTQCHPEGLGGGRHGALAPSHCVPRQALPPKTSLFTARRQDFLLFQKSAFLQGPGGTAEIWQLSPSESETQGLRPASPAQLDPRDSDLAKPQTLGNHRSRLTCLSLLPVN